MPYTIPPKQLFFTFMITYTCYWITKVLCLCLLDFSAAFDTIDHNILITRLLVSYPRLCSKLVHILLVILILMYLIRGVHTLSYQRSPFHGGTENAGVENAIRAKLQGGK